VNAYRRNGLNAGLVFGRLDGTRRLYRLDPDGVGALRAYVDRFWNQALAAFREAAERDAKDAKEE
jgi:20S proteasome alpha/beta subunit